MRIASQISKDIPLTAALKTVELAGKYTIRVPDYFAVRRTPPGKATSVPVIDFESSSHNLTTRFEVLVKPYNEVHIGPDYKSWTVVRIKPGSKYFTISGGRHVYYSWSVVDNAYECTMNSPCPLNWPADSRYTAWYKFTMYDPPNNSIIEFTGGHYGRYKEVTGFEGVGKLLREIVIPSLKPIRQQGHSTHLSGTTHA
jgi:hypothetical protein